MESAHTIEFNTVVVSTCGEVAFLEGDVVASLRIGGVGLVDKTASHVGDEESNIATIGDEEFDTCGAVEWVGVVLLEGEYRFIIGSRNALEIVDNFYDG